MRIEAVTICVDYADFLAETLPLNRRQFDRMVVVTSPEDEETQRVCDYHDVDVVMTDVFEARWGEMHKSKGINVGLEHAQLDGWMVHLDADIVLPPKARQMLERADLDKTCLYGADRMRVPSHEAWREHQAMPSLQHDGYHVRFDHFPLMARFNAWHLDGYAPVGFFQLWHPHTSGVKSYPDDHSEADRTDVLFAAQWDRRHRHLLPEIAVYHLESEDCAQGTNWGGRQTQRWGHEPGEWRPAHNRQWRHLHHRHHHFPPSPYGDS